jgi:DNA adenine methylase
MSLIFAKTPSSTEVVNDLNGHAINLARCLADPDKAEALYRRCLSTMLANACFDDSVAWIKQRCDEAGRAMIEPHGNIEWAYHVLVRDWQGRNGVSGTRGSNHHIARRYTLKGGDASRRWRSVAESIPDWHERLRQVQIWSMDAFEMLEKIDDDKGIVIYCDPPYLIKSSKYLHDFGDEDHRRLACLLGRFQKTRVFVSYYEHPELENLYGGWSSVDLSLTKSMVNSTRSLKTVAPEVLLMNRELAA